jgi:molecular chaperone GrpE
MEEKKSFSASSSASANSSADKKAREDEKATEDKKAPAEKEVSEGKEDIKEKLEKCQKQKEEYLAGWQRARADFLNYKKEEMERIGGLMLYAHEEIILKILPVLDNFELAEKKILEDFKNDENPEGKPSASYGASIKGILQIKSQILEFLKNYGIEEIKSVGERFNPNFHEVVEEIKVKDKESGIIVEEIQKGYLIQGRVLRVAKVRVTK